MQVKRTSLFLAASVIASASAQAQNVNPSVDTSPVQAQAGQANAESADTGPEIVVTGTNASIRAAETTKRDSGVVVDGISADDIGALPDVSIAESLVRIPGVTANNDAGGFGQVSIRGLGPDLAITTYNNRILPTNDPGTRRVALGGLPTEGIGAAYVQKTSDAHTIEGGVSGVLGLESVHPLETKRHGFVVSARGIYNDTSDKMSDARDARPFGQRGEVGYIGRPTDNLGIALSYAYLKQSSASPSSQFDTYRVGSGTRADVNKDGVPDALASNAGMSIDVSDTTRHSVIGMVQWKPTPSLKLGVDGLYIATQTSFDTTQYFANGAANGAIGALTGGGTVVNNVASSFQGNVNLYRGVFARSDARDALWQGAFNAALDNGGPITVALDASMSRAIRNISRPVVNIENDATNAAGQVVQASYDFTDRDNPVVGFLPVSRYNVQQISTSTSRQNDVIKALTLDFAYKPGFSWLQSLAWGAKIDGRVHSQSIDNTSYTWTTIPARPDLVGDFLETPNNPLAGLAGYLAGPSSTNFPYIDVDKVLALRNAAGAVVNAQYGGDLGGSFNVREVTYALYGQANFGTGPLTGNVGVRHILTDQTVLGAVGTTPANTIAQRAERSYSFWLPSLNVKYDITRTLLGRFGASKTISRPNFQALSIGSAADLTNIGSGGTVNITRGNPNLLPYTSKSIDVGVEWYPSRSTFFAVQGYYKWVQNFTVRSTIGTSVTNGAGDVLPAFVTTTVNDPATRYFKGVEVILRQNFRFLPGFLSNFGVQANYNHNLTDVRETFTSIVNAAGAGTTATVPVNNYSRDLVNAQLFYSRPTVDIRAAYRWYSPYSRIISQAVQSNAAGILDLSGSVALVRNLRFVGTVTNVLRSKDILTIPDSRDANSDPLFRNRKYNGQTFVFGLRANF